MIFFPKAWSVHGSFDKGSLPFTNGYVIIESDVCVGSGSVIAAGSAVVKDVSPHTIFGGNPARFIKDRLPKNISKQLLEIKW